MFTLGAEAKSNDSSVLDVGNFAAFQPSLHAAFPVEQLQLTQLEQEPQMVHVLRGAATGDLLALGRHRRQLQCLEVVLQEHRTLGLEFLHNVTPVVRLT